MFKRNLTTQAFDDISFDKKETPISSSINFPDKQELISRYGLMTLSGLFLAIFLLGALIYFDNKQDIKTILREHELFRIEVDSIKKELKDIVLVKQHDHAGNAEVHPVISYWGTIKAKGKIKALVELNGTRQLVVLGHLFESGWRMSRLFDEYLILESQSGISIQVNREEPAS